MTDRACYSNCSSLNLTTCSILTQEEPDVTEGKKGYRVQRQFSKFCSVFYDEDGCYNPKEYMAFVNKGDKFQDFSDLLGKIYQ